ncbi:hypothetical protein GE061_003044 [Apolygus lucorum]|uniref:Uncharacterized protein n=1 Tax=Apolygus lucorum TaxID=248454 RepID=A0A8S9X4Y1_APOLU|nr:hypothetical protein GE061_003044 [Apolygus lucorum]
MNRCFADVGVSCKELLWNLQTRFFHFAVKWEISFVFCSLQYLVKNFFMLEPVKDSFTCGISRCVDISCHWPRHWF